MFIAISPTFKEELQDKVSLTTRVNGTWFFLFRIVDIGGRFLHHRLDTSDIYWTYLFRVFGNRMCSFASIQIVFDNQLATMNTCRHSNRNMLSSTLVPPFFPTESLL